MSFEWDDENSKHLAAHKVTTTEFEYVLTNNPVDLGYELVEDEDRYRSVGLTSGGRLLTIVWTTRNGRVRAVTAFPATISDKKAFWEMSR
ncbi:MAG: BrnT family toxin [Bryobacteraceae bacterium]